jgi:RNA-directed DNA polymerase
VQQLREGPNTQTQGSRRSLTVVSRQKTGGSTPKYEQLAFALEEEGEVSPEPSKESKPSAAADPMRALTQSLMELVIAPDNMRHALKRVQANGGSAGIDGVRVAELPDYLRTHWPRIRQELLEGTYKPQPVRRVEIPKPDGGVRLLGIPTVVDRLVQQALLQTLTPLYDPTFSPSSYGFRPGKSAHMAVSSAKKQIAEGRGWVVDLDLEKFFDRVNHDILMGRLAKRIGDERMLALIRRYLEAGVLLNGVVVTTEEGTPQGGPLSPLLANILLDDLDKELERRGHRFCRYADDCNIYVRSRRAGERTLASVTHFLETKLKLKVNRAKSAVDRPVRRKFLGFTLTRYKGEVRQWIASKSKKRMMEKVRAITKRNRGVSLSRVLAELRAFTNGWVAYFWHSRTPSVFQELDSWIRHRLRCYQWKQWKNWRNRAKQLVKAGVGRWLAHGVASKGYGPWRVSDTPAMTRALTNAKLKSLGYASLHERYLSFASV